jgi:phage-related protein
LDVPDDRPLKPLFWMGSSYKDLKSLPEEVKDIIGRALYDAQCGDKHPQAKPLRGYGGAGVLEMVSDFMGDTYRAVYTIRFAKAVYVLHVFQKKAHHGISTPKHEIDLIRDRFHMAEDHYRVFSKGGAG